MICKIFTGVVYGIGVAGFGGAWYLGTGFTSAPVLMMAFAWAGLVLLVTALSIYIRSAFYTCLYVWAITAEEVEEAMRADVAPPAPLAAALTT